MANGLSDAQNDQMGARFWWSLRKMAAQGPAVRIPDGVDRRRTEGFRR